MVIQKFHRQFFYGFSFVELLASVAIIGVLASVAVPFVETVVRREKERDLRIALRDIRQAIDAYKLAASIGKIVLKPEQSGYPPSLLELVSGVNDISRVGAPKMYFLRKIPRDPFHPDQSLPALETWKIRSFQSPPDHPAKGDDVFDIYSSSQRLGSNTIRYSEW